MKRFTLISVMLFVIIGFSLVDFQDGLSDTQDTLDETSAVVSDVQDVADTAEDGEDLAISIGGMLAPLAGPYAPWILALLGVWRAKCNRDIAREIATSVEPAIDKSKVRPQSAKAKRVVDEAQGKTRVSLPI